MIMVKPAMTSLDVFDAARRSVRVPLAAYHVSGEYAMVQAAAAAGWIDGPAVALEQLIALKRAGADFILTYFAAEMAEPLVADPPPCASNADWFARAQRVIPGGVDSPVRSFASVGGTPYTVVRGEGPYVVDVEGTRYIDLVQSYGAVLLGHAHPVVTDAITAGRRPGAPPSAPRRRARSCLAEAICERVPGCEQVRLVSSGTEAAMSAVRLARGVTAGIGWSSSTAATTATPTASWPAAGAAWPRWAAGLGRGAGGSGGRHGRAALQRRARAGRPGGLRHRRAGGGQHEPRRARPRVPGRVARAPAMPPARC